MLAWPIVIRTDHAALTFHMKTPEPVDQQGRWLDLLSEYVITIQHLPGRVHGNNDTLLRRPCEHGRGWDCWQCCWAAPGSVTAPANSAGIPAVRSSRPPNLQQPSSPGSPNGKSYYLHRLFSPDSSESKSPANSQVSDIVSDQLETP